MTFRVEVTAEAERDADAILDWLLSQQAGDTGVRWFTALEEAIASLAEFPERCPLAPEARFFPLKYVICSMVIHHTSIAFCSHSLRARCTSCTSVTVAENQSSTD